MNKPSAEDIRKALEWADGIISVVSKYGKTYGMGRVVPHDLPCLRTIRAALKGIDAVIKTATNMMNCSHELCSMSEAVYEEIHGKMFLNIVNSCCSGIEVVDE